MYPILATWGGIVIPAWHVFLVAGVIAGYFFLLYLFNTYEPELLPHLSPLYALSYIGGYWGARALSLVIEDEHFSVSSLVAHGSMTFYGGFIGALFVGITYVLIRRAPFLRLWDLFMPAVLLGLAIGRVGCFLNGDDYGIPVTIDPVPWWAVVFPYHEVPVPRVPVQLIESGSVAMWLLLIMCCFKKLKKHPGFVGHACLAGYCVIRFCDEYLRDDDRGWLIQGVLSPSQGISLALLFALILSLLFFKKKNFLL